MELGVVKLWQKCSICQCPVCNYGFASWQVIYDCVILNADCCQTCVCVCVCEVHVVSVLTEGRILTLLPTVLCALADVTALCNYELIFAAVLTSHARTHTQVWKQHISVKLAVNVNNVRQLSWYVITWRFRGHNGRSLDAVCRSN
jgi:hypothetical protein